MKTKSSVLSCEDVLSAFAVEPNHDRSTLERYLRDYPQYAMELAHLSHELSRPVAKDTELSSKDRAAIDEAWRQYSSSSPVAANIFATLSVPQLRGLASGLGVPRQIISAFREQRVVVSSVPQRFLAQVAAALSASVDEIKAALTIPSEISYARSYKADEKPTKVPPATFEQLLIEAQVPGEKRAELMAEDN